MPSQISLRRTAAIAAVLFVLILAFLAGRVHAGADPAQVAAPAAESVRSAEPTPAPDDDAAPYGADPYGGPPQGTVPDQGTVPSPGGQDFDPPTTQAS